MNDHSRRLVEAVFKAIRRYEDGAVDEEELLRDIEGISEAIEEQDVQNLVSDLAVKIDESRYLYNVEEGKRVLSLQIDKFREAVLKLDRI